jgi:hypothetical protein
MMVAGVILARHAAQDIHFTIGLIGVAQTVAGGLVLAWALRHDQDLHDPDAPARAIVQVGMTRLIGLATVLFTGTGLVLALWSLV